MSSEFAIDQLMYKCRIEFGFNRIDHKNDAISRFVIAEKRNRHLVIARAVNYTVYDCKPFVQMKPAKKITGKRLKIKSNVLLGTAARIC